MLLVGVLRREILIVPVVWVANLWVGNMMDLRK